MDLVFIIEVDEFIVGAPEGHEAFQVAVSEACDLADQCFCKPAINEFLLFFQYQPVLEAPHHLVSPELEGVDQAVGVQVASRGCL